jgi:hypothetical protein
VALNLFGFFAVALLSGSMAEGARSARVRLDRASTELADLLAVNQNVIDSLPSGLVTTDPSQHVLTSIMRPSGSAACRRRRRLAARSRTFSSSRPR